MNTASILDGLNEQQREAVCAVDGPWLVVAGAGSGKTTVLTRRVAKLISEGIDPDSILLLTFTRAAARSMIERAKMIHSAAVEVQGGTFHSIGHRLVVDNHALLRMDGRPTIIDPEDVKSAFKKIAAGLKQKGENLPTAGTIAKIHSLAVNMKWTVDDVVLDRFPQFSHAIDFMSGCVAAYRDYKRERGLLDYDDLLVGWDRMLDNADLAAAIRRKFRYILVDEHQDSNALQCSILTKLGGTDPNIMVVGDPAQSIYAFRGSAPRTMFNFIETWPQTRTIQLVTNYRSTGPIIDVANWVDRSMSERFDRQLEPADQDGGPIPRLITVPTMENEAGLIADMVLQRKSEGIALGDQAILVRSLASARHIEVELKRRRIPHRVAGGIRITDAAHVKDLLCLARVVVNRHDELAWIRILTMAKGIGDRKAVDLCRSIRATAATSPGVVSVLDAQSQKFHDLAPIRDAYSALVRRQSPIELLSEALRVLDGLFGRRYDDWRTRRHDLMAVIGLSESFESLDTFLSSIVLEHAIDKKAEVVGQDEDDERPLTLSTVHSAKGLEWEVVYIPAFLDGNFPSHYAQSHEHVEEEKRVLYVAVTRAARELIFTKPFLGRHGAISAMSPFEQIIGECVEAESVGTLTRPRSFAFGLAADIDIYG